MFGIEAAALLLLEQRQTPENALEVGHGRNEVFLDRRMGGLHCLSSGMTHVWYLVDPETD